MTIIAIGVLVLSVILVLFLLGKLIEKEGIIFVLLIIFGLSVFIALIVWATKTLGVI